MGGFSCSRGGGGCCFWLILAAPNHLMYGSTQPHQKKIIPP